MKNDLLRAQKLLREKPLTCVFCKGDEIFTSSERGIKPLLRLLENREKLSGFSAADKIVGRAAAFLYLLLDVSEVYAEVMSEGGEAVLKANGIGCSCGVLIKEIRNRENTGICPMEIAVAGIRKPEEAYSVLKNKSTELQNNKRAKTENPFF